MIGKAASCYRENISLFGPTATAQESPDDDNCKVKLSSFSFRLEIVVTNLVFKIVEGKIIV